MGMVCKDHKWSQPLAACATPPAQGERSPASCLRPAQVLIQGGELVMGTLCKKTLGASGGSLIHVIWMEEGPEAARAFLSQTQYLVNHWLLQHGFSIGIGDTVADAATMLIISDIINKARAALAPRVRAAARAMPLASCGKQRSSAWDGSGAETKIGPCHLVAQRG